MHLQFKQSPRSQSTREVSEGNIVSCPAIDVLSGCPLGGLANIRCEIHEGKAILHGEVSSFYLKQFAQEAVKKINGVEFVVNRVSVVVPK